MKNITDTWLKNLKPKTTAQEHRDPSCRGLRIRITPTGKKSFVYNYQSPIDKKIKRVMLGNYPAMTLKDARVTWANLSDLRKKGTDPREYLQGIHQEHVKETEQQIKEQRKEKQEGKNPVTVTQLINTYLDEYSSVEKKSWREDQRVLNREFGAYYGNEDAYSITREQIRGLVNKKRKAGKNTQAWHMIAIIRGMYNWAIETPGSFTTPFQFNPAIGVYSRNERKKFKPKARVRKWHEEELKAVLKLFPEKYSDLLTFILLTGCRFGEAVSMQWSNIYCEEWRQTDTKNETDHTVYLSTQAQEILNRQPKTDAFVWSNPRTNSGHVRIDVVINALHKTDFKDASGNKIGHWTVHDFRRAMSSWLGKNLVPKDINDRMLNHVNAGVYETYNQESYDQPAKEWWQKWGNHIEELKQ